MGIGATGNMLRFDCDEVPNAVVVPPTKRLRSVMRIDSRRDLGAYAYSEHYKASMIRKKIDFPDSKVSVYLFRTCIYV